MNRSRLVAMFVVALLIAGAASMLVLIKLKQSARASASSTYRVVALARDLELGSKLTAEDVKLVEWSGGSLPQGAVTDVSKAVGRAILYPMFRDEAILEGKLAPVGAGAGMAAVIPEGMRAVSIRVDDVVAVAGFVGPSTRVDVLLTGNPSRTQQGSESLTKTILENVQVLAAGQKFHPDAQGKPEAVNVVTLLCTPEDAAKVTLAASEGRIQLVLRNPVDKLQTEKKAMVLRAALYGEGVPKPAPAAKKVRTPPPPPVVVAAPPPPQPPATTSIEILRGEVRSRVELPVDAAQLRAPVSPEEKRQ
ncbi:MAG: Flp pilus assembly protein CpaB [Acidobacteria bacterium]|nr:Flp pilus assembly protein CpaB [Acidobacteriota bacterium]